VLAEDDAVFWPDSDASAGPGGSRPGAESSSGASPGSESGDNRDFKLKMDGSLAGSRSDSDRDEPGRVVAH
jgi:hypothetical protein